MSVGTFFLAILITTAAWLLAVVVWFFWAKRKLRRLSDHEALEWMRRWFGDE